MQQSSLHTSGQLSGCNNIKSHHICNIEIRCFRCNPLSFIHSIRDFYICWEPTTSSLYTCISPTLFPFAVKLEGLSAVDIVTSMQYVTCSLFCQEGRCQYKNSALLLVHQLCTECLFMWITFNHDTGPARVQWLAGLGMGNFLALVASGLSFKVITASSVGAWRGAFCSTPSITCDSTSPLLLPQRLVKPGDHWACGWARIYFKNLLFRYCWQSLKYLSCQKQVIFEVWR